MSSPFLFFFLSLRYTCPFVEKFSIDIETYYKPDTGNQGDVFNMSSAEKRQRTVGKSVVTRTGARPPQIPLKTPKVRSMKLCVSESTGQLVISSCAGAGIDVRAENRRCDTED